MEVKRKTPTVVLMGCDACLHGVRYRFVAKRAAMLRDEPVQNALGVKDMVNIARQLSNKILSMKLFQTYRTRRLVRAFGDGRLGSGCVIR